MTMPLEKLQIHLNQFPSVDLCKNASPIHQLQNIAKIWELGFQLEIKRDDIIGPAFGGNKSRQLEFILGDAISKGSDCLVGGGALQSNYCRQLTAACGILGLDCYLVLSDAYKQKHEQGSHLLTKLLGAKISYYDGPLGEGHESQKKSLFETLNRQGRRPYLISYPSSEVLGSLGYLKACIELLGQIPPKQFPERILMPAVGASFIGVALGLHLLGLKKIEVIGIMPLKDEYQIEKAIQNSIQSICELMEIREELIADLKLDLRDGYVGGGYSQETKESSQALVDFARHEGVMLDPVYSSKAAAALKDLPKDNKRTLFWHTGGSVAIFAYSERLLRHIDE